MTKKEVLRLLLAQAGAHGFNLQAWFQSKIARTWPGLDEAIERLTTGHLYYTLLFSHEFARHFWKQGEQIQFVVPNQKFSRLNARGELITISRRAYVRRTLKPHAWQYHLREMVTFEEPLRYIRRYLLTRDGPKPNPLPPQAEGHATKSVKRLRRA